MKTSELPSPPLTAAQLHAHLLQRRIDNLQEAVAIFNGTSSKHEDAETFQRLTEFAIRDCDIQPVELAKAFKVSTGTVSRWRTGKNAPHRHMRPLIIAWMKDSILSKLSEAETQLEQIPADDDENDCHDGCGREQRRRIA